MQQELLKSQFDYELPSELIAQDPLESRTSSRLLIMDKTTGKYIDDYFYNIGDYLNRGDVLVINNTKVIPARIIGKRKNTGGVVEILLLKRLNDVRWECLAGPGKKAKIGDEIIFGDGVLECKVYDITDEGNRIIEFKFDGVFEEILDQLGQMPLPPYITHKLKDKNRYQTIYAKYDGSAAAPTAGLHFDQALMDSLKSKGIIFAPVTLHVGLGTFRPVKEDNVLNHHMHKEWCEISDETRDVINSAKKEGRRVICVGTTSARTVESLNDGKLVISGSKETDIFIYPPYEFKIVDGLVTNFHLPMSTLIMLVSALSSRENILNAYKHAVDEKYRFFSFGDAMFVK